MICPIKFVFVDNLKIRLLHILKSKGKTLLLIFHCINRRRERESEANPTKLSL
jgi:hypothetical protein